jgi:hypothetical protein
MIDCEHCRAAHSPVVGVAIRTSAERRFSLALLIELRTSQQSATQPMEFRVVVAFAASASPIPSSTAFIASA